MKFHYYIRSRRAKHDRAEQSRVSCSRFSGRGHQREVVFSLSIQLNLFLPIPTRILKTWST